MSVTPVSVPNALGRSLFLVNRSASLLELLRLHSPGAGIADLQRW